MHPFHSFFVLIKFKFSNTYINFYIIAKWFPCFSHRAQNKRDGDKIIVYDFMLASVEKKHNAKKTNLTRSLSTVRLFSTDIIFHFSFSFFNSHKKNWIFPNKNDIYIYIFIDIESYMSSMNTFWIDVFDA